MNPSQSPARQLILASGSAYKQALLARLGLDFKIHPAALDETAQPNETPRQTATRLARAKAAALATTYPDAWIIGADQVIALGQKRFSKPQTAQKARAQLAELSGKTHQLFAAIAIRTPNDEFFEDIAEFHMQMRPLTAPQIADYVALDQPLNCAGAYKVEAAGIRLFSAMHGTDHTAIIGLPLTHIQTQLEYAGFFD